MEAIRTGNPISSRNSPVSSQFSESIVDSSLGGSELDIESLARNGRKVVVVAEKIVAFESF